MKQIFNLMLLLIAFQIVGKAQNTFPSTGNVGIGTSSPSNNLDITSSGITTLKINSTSSSNDNVNLILGGDNGSNHGYWKLSKSPTSYTGTLSLSYNTGIYGGDHPMMHFIYSSSSGQVVIGSSSSLVGGCALAVEGKIGARELIISNQTPFPDYVFYPNYKLQPLSEIEKFIAKNYHLPDMPSTTEVKKNGLEVGKITNILVQKVEELTLYIIELNKKIEKLETENKMYQANN